MVYIYMCIYIYAMAFKRVQDSEVAEQVEPELPPEKAGRASSLGSEVCYTET